MGSHVPGDRDDDDDGVAHQVVGSHVGGLQLQTEEEGRGGIKK